MRCLLENDEQKSETSNGIQLTARKVLATLEKADCASASSLIGSGLMSSFNWDCPVSLSLLAMLRRMEIIPHPAAAASC